MKKGFSLVELIIVIGVISILMVSFTYHLKDDQKDYLYSETCINKLHGDMSTFLYSAMTSKGLYIKSGASLNMIYPIKYVISINTAQNKIFFQYTDANNKTGVFLVDDLLGSELGRSKCSFNDGYVTKLSGTSYDININKDSMLEQSSPTFSLSSTGVFLQTTEMYLCYKDDPALTGYNICKEIANFITDVRIQAIKKKRCISIDKRTSEDGSGDYSRCLQRDQ